MGIIGYILQRCNDFVGICQPVDFEGNYSQCLFREWLLSASYRSDPLPLRPPTCCGDSIKDMMIPLRPHGLREIIFWAPDNALPAAINKLASGPAQWLDTVTSVWQRFGGALIKVEESRLLECGFKLKYCPDETLCGIAMRYPKFEALSSFFFLIIESASLPLRSAD